MLFQLLLVIAPFAQVLHAQTSPPASITPKPHVIISLNGTMSTAVPISFDCSSTYSQDFSNSLKDVVARVNNAISNSQLCPTARQVTSIAGDVKFLINGNMAYTTFTIYFFPADVTTLRGVEICAFDVQGFAMSFDNWRQPIIQGYGCPQVTFNPTRFDFIKSEWSCF